MGHRDRACALYSLRDKRETPASGYTVHRFGIEREREREREGGRGKENARARAREREREDGVCV